MGLLLGEAQTDPAVGLLAHSRSRKQKEISDRSREGDGNAFSQQHMGVMVLEEDGEGFVCLADRLPRVGPGKHFSSLGLDPITGLQVRLLGDRLPGPPLPRVTGEGSQPPGDPAEGLGTVRGGRRGRR